jgi:hypothetical protein
MSARRPSVRAPLPCAQHADHAGAADAFVHLDARLRAFAWAMRAAVRCFGKAEFGMCVDITPEA